MKQFRGFITSCILGAFTAFLSEMTFAATKPLSSLQKGLVQAGDEMLENLEVSYVYGGSKVGSVAQCETCNACLEEKKPSPKERFIKCSSCSGCSLDCSHFTQLVYARAGLDYPYLTTSQMINLEPATLEKKYNLYVVGSDVRRAEPGDLLVYPGHVVMLEASLPKGFGDVIHATGGKDIREPGQGIQRERHAFLSQFRGDLRRILRHRKLESERVALYKEFPIQEAPTGPVLRRMRRVEKKNP